MWSSQVSETDTSNLLKLSCAGISERLLLMIQHAPFILFRSRSYIGIAERCIYGFVLGLGLVIAKRDFCFKTKTRPSLSCKVLEARPRLLHSRLESRARPLSNELESTRDPRLWSRGHKSGCSLEKIDHLISDVHVFLIY